MHPAAAGENARHGTGIVPECRDQGITDARRRMDPPLPLLGRIRHGYCTASVNPSDPAFALLLVCPGNSTSAENLVLEAACGHR